MKDGGSQLRLGSVIAITGGTIPHNDITLNFYRALYPQVQSNGCRINLTDVKVEVSSNSPYYYPNVIVTCAPRDLTARKLLRYLKLIIEVLSPGTEAKDQGEKLAQYRSSPTLQEYVLVDSEKISVECYRRGEGRLWLYYPYPLETLLRWRASVSAARSNSSIKMSLLRKQHKATYCPKPL